MQADKNERPEDKAMARILTYGELTTRTLPTRSDVSQLAARLTGLHAFRSSDAVVCGSVCWNAHAASSDVDVAHVATEEFPRIDEKVREAREAYRIERQGDLPLAVPRVDIVLVGTAAQVHADAAQSLSAVALSATPEAQASEVARPFADVALRFADHIGAIARARGDPWRTFVQRHLSGLRDDPELRVEGIRSFVETVCSTWEELPLRVEDRDGHGHFTPHQCDLLSQVSGFNLHLMRRILGELGRYPSPDRATDIVAAFTRLEEPWARQIVDAQSAFNGFVDAYHEMRLKLQPGGANPACPPAEFHARLEGLATSLPLQAIREAVWSYLGARS